MIDRRRFIAAGVAGMAGLVFSQAWANPGSWPMPGPGRNYGVAGPTPSPTPTPTPTPTPPPGDPAWTHFATESNGIDNTGQGSVSVLVNNVPAGALVVVNVSAWSSSMVVSGVSDGTSAFVSTPATPGNTILVVQQWYLLSANSGNRVYTATFTSGGDYPIISAQVVTYSGTIAYDTGNRADGFGDPISSGAISTTGTYPAVFGVYHNYNPVAISSPLIGGNAWQNYTNVLADYVHAGWYDGSVSSGAATASIGSGQPWVCGVIAFKEAS